jgi:cytochrome c553
MGEKGRSPRWLSILLVAIVVLIVAAVIAVSIVQRPAPPGAAILGKALPENHPPGPCYRCHKGMGTGQEVHGRTLPEDHPADRCAPCHEGSDEPAIAQPGTPQSVPEETLEPAGSVLDLKPR